MRRIVQHDGYGVVAAISEGLKSGISTLLLIRALDGVEELDERQRILLVCRRLQSCLMAFPEASSRFRDLRLDTGHEEVPNLLPDDGLVESDQAWIKGEDKLLLAEAMEFKPLELADDHSATTPIPIATHPNTRHGAAQLSEFPSLASGPSPSPSPSLNEFLRSRTTSVTFDATLKLDSGERRIMPELLQQSNSSQSRECPAPKSTIKGMDHHQSHDTFPPAQHSPIPIRSGPREKTAVMDDLQIAKELHPLIPTTTDDRHHLSQSGFGNTGFTSACEQRDFATSLPTEPVPDTALHSFEDSVIPRRYVDRSQTVAADFFSKASSFRKSPVGSSARQIARRSISSSTRSPKSAASSFLASFSAGHRGRPLTGQDDCENPSPEAEGQMVGDTYVIGKQVGYGGFSVIKEAIYMDSDGSQRKVAAKIVRRNILGKNEADNDQAQLEFDHEVELWRFLKHPHILPLESVYKTDDATFCFMPLITGGTLFDAVRAKRSGLPLDLAKQYSYQLATAVRYLHVDLRVAHRDIKLENCLIDTSDEEAIKVRLCDFGMAEWITSEAIAAFDHAQSASFRSSHLTRRQSTGPDETCGSAFLGGSLEYAAPEVVRLAQESSPAGIGPHCNTREVERNIVSPAGDIWAFGVCVYTMIVGSRPFQDSFSPRVAMAILAGDWDHERVKEKGGAHARDLVRGCLEIDLHARWNSNDILDCEWLREEVEKGGDEQDGGSNNPFGSHSRWGTS